MRDAGPTARAAGQRLRDLAVGAAGQVPVGARTATRSRKSLVIRTELFEFCPATVR